MPHEIDAQPATAADAPPWRRMWLGLGLLLASAFFFSLHNTLARLLYDEGVAPTTIAAARTWAIVILFFIVFGVRRNLPRVPRAAWLAFALTAICYCAQNPLFLYAFKFIPVSLAVLVLYIYPIVVALMAAAIGQERLRVTILLAAFVAFLGVALVMAEGGADLDWRGIAISLAAAILLSGNIVGAAQLNRHLGAIGVPRTLSLVGAVVFGLLMAADGGPTLPATAQGWWLFAAATAASPAAIITFYVALPLAGAPRSALAMNTEPIVTVLLASMLLGEVLAPLQLVGGALIVGAIAVSAVTRLTSRRL